MNITYGARGAATLAGGLAALGLLVTATPAAAGTAVCATELGAVATAVSAGEFVNARDQANLLATLDGAGEKIAVDKYADAIDKLLAVADKAVTLAGSAKPKLDGPGAAAITVTVDAAVTCIAGQ